MKKIFIGVALLLGWCAVDTADAIEVMKGTCELAIHPIAVQNTAPRFGWQLDEGSMQSAYQLEVYKQDKKGYTLIWNTGKVMSESSQLIRYKGTSLEGETDYRWRVKVWDTENLSSEWSEYYEFTTAPDKSFLDAQWIGAITRKNARLPEGRKFHGTELKDPKVKALWAAVDTLAKKSIYLRRTFQTNKKINKATVYICGLGFYELTLNGKKVGESEFAPLWTDYDKTVYYNVFDVTSLLREGKNVAGVLLGNGFYNVQGGRYRKLLISFGAPTLFFKMRIRYEDGTEQIVRSGSDWKYSLSPIRFNCIYGGEDYDARLGQSGWDKPGFDDTAWRPVVIQKAPKGKFRPQQAAPVKIMEYYGVKSVDKLTSEEVKAACKSMKRTVDPSAFILDMGQNLAGFPEITVKGKKGQTVTLLVGESLTEEGAVNQKQTGRQHYYQYTLKGDGEEIWHPRFSYYGFRYIQVEGAVMKGDKNPNKLPVIRNIRSCFVYNSAARTGTFECSNPIFNAAHRLIDRAVRSNMQSVFTDCPHREKLGWLEQDHLNGPGLLFNYDLTRFFPKLMQDMADAQHPDGLQPTIAPQYVVFEGKWLDPFLESPEWGSAIVMLPFLYADYYGDTSLIETYYPQMRRYVDYLTTRAESHIVSHGLGDWYDYGNFRAGFSRNTPVPLVATAHYYMDLCKVAEAARMVGNQYDADYYTHLSKEVKEAFNQRFFNKETCQYGTGSQCSNALPLFLDMVEPQYRGRVMNNLVKDVHQHGDRLTTGDVGNRYLFQTLARNGQNELMYRMHNHEEAPGYGFQLKFGATTLTEQWDPRQGSSWNHFMMGQIEEWFYASLAGIGQKGGSRGFKELEIRPCPVGDLKWVKASFQNLYGKITVSWKVENGIFSMDVHVPANCSADVWLPEADAPQRVLGGWHTFTQKIK